MPVGKSRMHSRPMAGSSVWPWGPERKENMADIRLPGVRPVPGAAGPDVHGCRHSFPPSMGYKWDKGQSAEKERGARSEERVLLTRSSLLTPRSCPRYHTGIAQLTTNNLHV